METTITATELSKRLSDVLNRVKYRGERFIVQRNGETVAAIAPVSVKPGISLGEALTEMGDLFPVGGGFADDLAAIQAAQGRAEIPEWPD